MKALNETKNFLVSVIIAKSWNIGKEIVTNLIASSTFNPLTSRSNVLRILSDRALRNYRASS